MVFIDALMLKIRDGVVTNRPVYLAIGIDCAVRNLEEFRGSNVGIRSSEWKQALQAFTIYFDGRIPTP